VQSLRLSVLPSTSSGPVKLRTALPFAGLQMGGADERKGSRLEQGTHNPSGAFSQLRTIKRSSFVLNLFRQNRCSRVIPRFALFWTSNWHASGTDWRDVWARRDSGAPPG